MVVEKDTDVKYVVPQSYELKAFLPVQERILQDELCLEIDKRDTSTDPY